MEGLGLEFFVFAPTMAVQGSPHDWLTEKVLLSVLYMLVSCSVGVFLLCNSLILYYISVVGMLFHCPVALSAP